MTCPLNILLLLTIPAFISVETVLLQPNITTATPTTPAKPTTAPATTPTAPIEIPKPTPTHNLCNESQNERLRNVSRDGRECLKKFIFSQATHTMGVTDETSCNTIKSVNQSIFTLLNASEPCFEKKKVPIIFNAGKTLVEILNFSVAEDKHFKELFENGFAQCVSKTRENNKQCVLNGTGLKKYRPRLQMSNILNLELAETGCSKSRIIRLCVEKTLRNELACNTTHIEYVNSLFNYTSRHCMQTLPNDENIRSSKMNPGTIAVTVLVLAAVVIVSSVAIHKRVSERRMERCSQRVHYVN